MLKISIVVPVYNVERYIGKCINSLLQQTYRNIEIIVVDDVATDNSILIAEELLNSQKEIKYNIIRREVNGGLSAARNTGLKHATTENVIFIDSDDWCEPNMIEKMIGAMEESGADIVVCNIYGCIDGKPDKQTSPYFLKGKVTNETALMALFSIKEAPSIWRNLYKKRLFDNLQFAEGVVYEDKLLQPYLWNAAAYLYFIDIPLYNYVIGRADSITSTVDFYRTYKKYELIPSLLSKMEQDILCIVYNNNAFWRREFIYYDYAFCRNLLLKFSTQNRRYNKNLGYIFKLFKEHISLNKIYYLMGKGDMKLILHLLFFKVSPLLFWKKFSRI